jgi:BirA family biotin operon repressor/biotin-[acetyl-CoA-carboxylase] ligase
MSTSPSDLRGNLASMDFDVRWVNETGSTNADVMAVARQGEPEGIVVAADHQTAGRGRRDRTWEAPPNASLMFTVLLRPPARVAGLATMAVALSGAEAVEELTGVRVRLKWPNDLVWPGDGTAPDRKLAGVLAEADWSDPARPAVAVGMGLNVDWQGPMPGDLAATAVALDELVPEPPDRRALLDAFLRRLDRIYEQLAGGDAPGVRRSWEARSATIDRDVRVDLGDEQVVGRAVGITDEGHLVVEPASGERRTFTVGDVVHLRSAT